MATATLKNPAQDFNLDLAVMLGRLQKAAQQGIHPRKMQQRMKRTNGLHNKR